MGFADLINNSIKKNEVWKPNSNQLAKIRRLGTQLKLWKIILGNQRINWKKFEVWSSIEDQIKEIWNQWQFCKKYWNLRIQLNKTKGEITRNQKD